MTKYFLDCEFIDGGKVIDLVSIGIVSSDGREYYAQSCEFYHPNASEWVRMNVLSHLEICPWAKVTVDKYAPYIKDIGRHEHQGQCMDRRQWVQECPWRTRAQIKEDILAFINEAEDDIKPELWGWCAGYDFVALCQLFGTMIDLPQGWPHYIKDLQHILDERGISDDQLPEQEGKAHNALEDARHIKKLWGYIVRNDAWQ
jgi:hypothetical protein